VPALNDVTTAPLVASSAAIRWRATPLTLVNSPPT
jgi:hypothetical protein